MKKTLLLGLFAAMLGSAGCYYDKYENQDPNFNSCDTMGTVTYTQHLKPILDGQCTICHSPGGGNAGGYNFKDYTSTKNAASRLPGAVNHAPGYAAMPSGGTKLDNCSIKKIEKWVKTGTPL